MQPQIAPRALLRYRFGFHLCRRGATPRELRAWFARHEWRTIRRGDYDLTLHPDARQTVHVAGPGAGGALLHFVGDVWTESGTPLAARIAGMDTGGSEWLESLADDLCGRFALFVFEGGRVRVLHDPIGSQSVFYARSGGGSGDGDGRLAIASHADLVAQSIDARRDGKARRILKDPGYLSRPRALPGGWTIHRGVRALIPNNLYDSDRGASLRYWPRAPLQPSTEDGFHAALARHLAGLERYVSERYRPVFGLTGGVDTRLAIASCLRAGLPFETVTWESDALRPHEHEIVRKLAATLGRENPELPILPSPGRIGRLAAADAGRMRPPSPRIPAMFEAFGDRPDCVFMKGWGAEIMRGFYNGSAKRLRGFEDPAAMAGLAYRFRLRPAGLRPAIRAMADFIATTEWPRLAGLGFDPNDLFYWEHRMALWGASMHAEMDVAIRSIVTFNSRPLYAAALGLPTELRLGKRLFLDAIGRMAPALAAIPLADGDPRAA